RIVDELAAASAAGLDFDETPDLLTALNAAVAALWERIEATPGEQLLTYEITTHALRNAELRAVAERQYEVSQAATEGLLTLAAQAGGATWTVPVPQLAGQTLAFVDGVTLRWLVDGDGAAARVRLASFAGYLATHARRGRRLRSVPR
ncbi:MAG: TetR/AcrR family transcriptional regulator, partial [Jatrophihabitantaceae bacterium]